MIPYYQDDLVTLYCADSREVNFFELPQAQCCITDPPYQPATAGGTHRLNDDGRGAWFDIPAVEDVDMVLSKCRAALHLSGAQYIFTNWTFHDALLWQRRPERPQKRIIWYKHGHMGMGGSWRANHELILGYWDPDEVAFYETQPDVILAFVPRGNFRLHPTAKPLSTIWPLIRMSTLVDDLIIDPFCGSGSTLEAARNLGRRALGIEKEEKYCEVAAERLRQLNLEV